MEYKVVENKEEGLEQITHLVKHFEENNEYYTSKDYLEEPTKMEFINHFFESLGWDVTNTNEEPPYACDVTTEESIDTDDGKKKPDYSFRIDGSNVFFVEAKKPNVNIKENEDPAYQLLRYAWSAKLDISILTDFEEFSVYTSHISPDKAPSSDIERSEYYYFKDYLKKWDHLWNIFSKEAVINGSLEKFSRKHVKNCESVDEKFLEEISLWREQLAINIYKNNRKITISQLNQSVQLLIDRIIFIRMAEDRNIQTKTKLEDLLNEKNIYSSFIELCKDYDDKYNSGLFHFEEEKEIDQSPDKLTPKLKIDNEILDDIIKNLYYPNSPYEFSVISPEILGKVYEEFLGKKIKFNEDEKIEINYKPEIEKQGGIYYTPRYIVDHIVKNTLGYLLKHKTLKSAKSIKILDPACGSGSFLIGAYDYLLNWYTNKYSKRKRPPENVIYKTSNGKTMLTIQEKKRILKDHIFGVDIDSEAVEVTKLSLMLKVLEDEKKDSLEKQLKLIKERALPYLGDNIKCGNSVVETKDICEEGIPFNKDINPFDWHDEFPQVFSKNNDNTESRGFDIIIGNPPYILEKTNTSAFDGLRKNKYYLGKMDIWHFFGAKGIDLLKNKGYISFIAPSNWITSDGASNFRKKISEDAKIISFINFGDYPIFRKNNKPVGANTMIYVMQKDDKKKKSYWVKYSELLTKKVTQQDMKIFLKMQKNIDTEKFIKYNAFFKTKNITKHIRFLTKDNSEIIEKIEQNSTTLNDNEMITGMDIHQDFLNKKNAKKMGRPENVGAGIFVLNENEKKTLHLNKNELEIIKPYYTTNELSRYYSQKENRLWIIYTGSEINKNNKILEYPNIKKHLDQFDKYNIITTDNKPYGLHRPKEEKVFLGEKIISLRKCPNRPQFSYVDFDCFVSLTFNVIKTNRFNLKVLTGILNSNLVYYYLKTVGKKQGSVLQIDQGPLKYIPIKYPNHDIEKKIERFVNKLNELNLEKINLITEDDKRVNKQEIKFYEYQVNDLVYELYGMSEKDIRIIEENIK